MAGILDPDWKETMLGTPGFSVTEYVKKYWQDKAAKDASEETAVEGEGDQETYALPGGETTTDWAESEHERMYPGHQAAANAAGFTMLGATTLNKDYVARQNTIKDILGKLPNESYNSGDWKSVFGKMSPEDINKTIETHVLGIDTSDVGTVDISGLLGFEEEYT